MTANASRARSLTGACRAPNGRHFGAKNPATDAADVPSPNKLFLAKIDNAVGYVPRRCISEFVWRKVLARGYARCVRCWVFRPFFPAVCARGAPVARPLLPSPRISSCSRVCLRREDGCTPALPVTMARRSTRPSVFIRLETAPSPPRSSARRTSQPSMKRRNAIADYRSPARSEARR